MEFLEGYILLVIIVVYVIVGRKYRWYWDKIFVKSMFIFVVGSKGMKFVGVDKM